MKRINIIILSMVFATGMPIVSMAMSHGEHGEHGKAKAEEMKHHGDMEMDHAKKKSHDMHQGHDMSSDDDFVEIGKDAKEGVVATVKVKTYDDETKAKMTNMGMDATHHVMVFFTDEKSGDAVSGGKAAIKIKGQEGKPVMLMHMGEGYGADVKLEGMMNTFEIGTKLGDGKKRQFSIMYHNM
jgi:hypothetical protein